MDEVGAEGITHDDQVSKVSVVGSNMATQTGVASRMFRALGRRRRQHSNDHDQRDQDLGAGAKVASVGCAARRAPGVFVARTTGDAKSWNQIKAERGKKADVDTLVSRLRDDALEALTLTGISVTENQARVTLYGVPDRPGIAADMFETIGNAGIFVDMIVQGYDGEDGSTSVSFTVHADDLEQELEVAKQIRDKHGMRDVQGGGNIAKVTVSGIGLRSHTPVATLLFQQLAAADINVEMISTSELQVNAVIDAGKAAVAADGLKKAFAESLL